MEKLIFILSLVALMLNAYVFAGPGGGGGPDLEILMRAQAFEGMTTEEAAHMYERVAQDSIHPYVPADRRSFGFRERLETERFNYLSRAEEDDGLMYQLADIPGREYHFYKEDVVEFHIKDVGVVTIEELIEENAFETKGSVEVLDSRLDVTKYYTTDGEVHFVGTDAVLIMKPQKVKLNQWF